MIERLSELSPRAKALLVAALVILAPLGGWLGYRLGFYLGGH